MPRRISTQLRQLERMSRHLLARTGAVCEEHDSMRLMAALGHISKAAEELKQAVQVREAIERGRP